MFPASKVREIYCMADNFCKKFTLIQVILILFRSSGFRCFKHYCKIYPLTSETPFPMSGLTALWYWRRNRTIQLKRLHNSVVTNA